MPAEWLNDVALLVAVSWVIVGVIAVLAVVGARPLARPGLLIVARIAVAVAIFGIFMAVASFIYFMISFSHFDTGIPEEQKQPLAVGMWVAGITGLGVGALAARRLGHRKSGHAG